MKIQNNLTVMAAAAVVLVLATFNPVYCKQTGPNLCPNNSSFYHVIVLRENCDFSSYMFVDLCSSDSCCNVVAKKDAYPNDIRGKRHTLCVSMFVCVCVCVCVRVCV